MIVWLMDDVRVYLVLGVVLFVFGFWRSSSG